MSFGFSTKGRLSLGGAARWAAAAMLPVVLAGCGATEGIGGTFLSGTLTGPKEMDPALYAATPVCPLVEVRDGTEFMPVYEGGKKAGDPQTIRFQVAVQRVARDCDFADAGIRVRVGVAGRVLSGQKGATGALTVPIRVAVVVGDRVAYSKVTTTPVNVQAPDYSALFSIVDEGVALSIADSKEATIYVGLDNGADPTAKKPAKGKKVTK